MRNWQYTLEEMAQMDDFAEEWKKTRRTGIKGPIAWRAFRKRHPWARGISADTLRKKYTNIKLEQYWMAYGAAHVNCPQDHASCVAPAPYRLVDLGATPAAQQTTIVASDSSIEGSGTTANSG